MRSVEETVDRYVSAFFDYRPFTPPFRDELTDEETQRDTLDRFIEMGRAEWQVLASFQDSRDYLLEANKEYFYACSSSEPQPAGFEALAGASVVGGEAVEGAPAGIDLLPLIGIEGTRGARFGEIMRGYVGTDCELSPHEYCLRPAVLARRLDCELRCLEAAGRALSGYHPQPEERYISVNVTPWLIADARGVVTKRRWHGSYLRRLGERLQDLARSASAVGLRLIVELVEGSLPRAPELLDVLWGTLGGVAASAGLAIDDQFGPGTDTPRLAGILRRAGKLGFHPLIVKIDYLAVSEILSYSVQHDEWARALGVLGDHVMLVGQRDQLCSSLIFEGYSGRERSDEYRRKFRVALNTARLERNWPDSVLMQG